MLLLQVLYATAKKSEFCPVCDESPQRFLDRGGTYSDVGFRKKTSGSYMVRGFNRWEKSKNQLRDHVQ